MRRVEKPDPNNTKSQHCFDMPVMHKVHGRWRDQNDSVSSICVINAHEQKNCLAESG